MRKSLLTVSLLALAVAGTTGCATKGYVRNQVGQVSSKVDTLSTSLEETQERTRKNEAKITEVDQKVGAAQTTANTAQQAATAADTKAVTATESAKMAGDTAKMAGEKADALDKSSKRIVYEVVLSEDSGNFKFNATSLPDEAKAKIDELVTRLKADPKGAYFEIEGHTDNVGDKLVNEKIGMERAEAVKRYLYEQHQIPLHRMNVISWGEAKPVTENKTRADRAQNRRVVIRILA
jgi:outer membrane protein OmpA-like peptidoglycan-associated protein